jgi:multiple sugar transport system substrate-binding protein
MKFKLFALLMIASLLLTACGGGGAATAAPAGSEATTTGGDTGGKTVIKIWGHQSTSFNDATQKAVDAFMAANPDIEVKYETFPWDVFIQTIQTSIPAGNAADVILIPGGYTCRYASGGQLLEVPADMMSLDQAKEIFYEAPLGGQTCDGKLYGFPAEYNIEYGGAYVNPAMFAEAGLAYPPQWKTWDDVVADASKLTKYDGGGAMSVAGLHYTNNDQLYTYFLAGILEQGGKYFAEDGKHFNFNSPEAVATIQKMMDMAQKDKVVDPVTYNAESNWVGESFATGFTAIGVLGSWYVGDAKLSHPEMKFDYVALPPMMGPKHRFTSTGGWGMVVTKGTQAPEAAWKLAAFLAANGDSAFKFNVTTGTIPAMKSVAADPKFLEAAPALAPVLPILGDGQYQGDLTDAGQLEMEIIYPNILDALQGLQTAQDAAKNIDDQANAMVDAAN